MEHVIFFLPLHCYINFIIKFYLYILGGSKEERSFGWFGSSCPSSSQAPFAPPDPMIIEQLQNKNDQIVSLETPNGTILAELADQKTQTRR